MGDAGKLAPLQMPLTSNAMLTEWSKWGMVSRFPQIFQ
jgi:hypothetical protein